MCFWNFPLAPSVWYDYIYHGGIRSWSTCWCCACTWIAVCLYLVVVVPSWFCYSILLVVVLLVCWRLLLLESSQLLFKTLCCTLLMAQWGYLHLTKAFLSSLWRSSRPVQTVFALWVGIPMTLYLADRLWLGMLWIQSMYSVIIATHISAIMLGCSQTRCWSSQ